MSFSRILALLSIVVAISATPMVLHEQRAESPAGFVRVGAAPASEMITLRVGLKSNNLAGLEEQLKSISTPGSSNFRQWLSMDDVKSYTQPSADTVSAFNAFASANGLTPTVISPNGDWVSITLPVAKANTLFAADFGHYTHPSIDDHITRTLSVSLPSGLVGHVDVLHPTTTFVSGNMTLPHRVTRVTLRALSPPTCLQDLYGIPTTPATEASNTLLVTGYQGQFAEQTDLTQFLSTLRPDISNATTFTLLTTDGGTNPQDPEDAGDEANLDVQYTAGIATNVPLDFLSVGGFDLSTAFLDTTTYLDGIANPPTVMTTSYGDNEINFGASVATKICNGYMALGARGISVIFASGDGGVRGGHDSSDQCDDNTFIPVFPADCPFVTSVGSTQGFSPEQATNFTSGGFSNVFPTPDYQTAAIAAFLQTIPDDFVGSFNKSGRGYPDVSTQGVNFETIDDGQVFPASGTSASSPTFAAVIALINDRLIAAQKPVLGFLNPFLYSNASSAFADITTGHNSGFVCPANSSAFDAATGWDPLTGWGTPKFADLLTAALSAVGTFGSKEETVAFVNEFPEIDPRFFPYLLPVIYIGLSTPPVREILGRFDSSGWDSIKSDIACVHICIHGLLFLEEFQAIHPGAYVYLWERLWLWIKFLDEHEDALCGDSYLPPEIRYVRFVSAIHFLHADEETKTMIDSSSGLYVVIGRAWHHFIRTKHEGGMAYVSYFLGGWHPNHTARNSAAFSELLAGSGGMRMVLASMVVSHLKHVLPTPDCPVTDENASSLYGVFRILSSHNDSEFEDALLSNGIVASLTIASRALTGIALNSGRIQVTMCFLTLADKAGWFLPARLPEALRAGLFEIAFTPTSHDRLGKPSPFITFLKSAILPASVYHSVLVQLRHSLQQVRDRDPATIFTDATDLARWESFVEVVGSRLRILERF
ncbi:Family S53 protease-like protein [Mycena sanguinolenta]|uniref:tripeptidyl-peptidase II n=1 Tax=Mycena sanguinolenta TaxID=230812 RepID=A0A8H6YGN8_9AGAR|nr:Family S53 protease-like protein [Mycena sanguinolenta]